MADLSGLSPEQLAVALEGPALAPPDNTMPNFDNPSNNNGLAQGILATCLALTTLMFLIRLYARFVLIRRVGFEEFLLIASYAFTLAFISRGYYQLNIVGFFVHQWDVRVRDMILLLQNYLICNNLQILSVGLLKVAILLDWMRIFVPAGTRGSFFWACHVVMWINILWTVIMLIAVNLSCIPHQAIWDLTVHGKCFDKSRLDIAAAAMALITDLAILVLPHRVIWRLHLSTRKKVGVSTIFCLGLFSCVAAAVRLPTVVAFDSSSDVAYDYSAVAFWALSEYTSGMLVLCVPSIPKVFEQVRNSGALASLRSWIGSSVPNTRNGSQSQSHHGGSRHAPHSRPRMYQQIDTHSGNVPMTRLKQVGPEEQPRAPLSPDDGAILRTTEFSTREDHESNSPKSYHDRQHPWIETKK
ncbi:uncharacterized protein PG986_015084 [Apiospora aurea]|uniref:Rhodopsin domain-containing protein n=1 Tax=Apiospora aurea TaxID=335848 RepID=A0ABR1PRK0_9PEZI